jgi:hypothetical protein
MRPEYCTACCSISRFAYSRLRIKNGSSIIKSTTLSTYNAPKLYQDLLVQSSPSHGVIDAELLKFLFVTLFLRLFVFDILFHKHRIVPPRFPRRIFLRPELLVCLINIIPSPFIPVLSRDLPSVSTPISSSSSYHQTNLWRIFPQCFPPFVLSFVIPRHRAQCQSLRMQWLRNRHTLHRTHRCTPQSHKLKPRRDIKGCNPVNTLGRLCIARCLVFLVQGNMTHRNEPLPQIRDPEFAAQRYRRVDKWLALFWECSYMFLQPFFKFWVGF